MSLGGAFDDEPKGGESGEPTIIDNGEIFSYQMPYYRTMMRISLGLDPPEKLAEVSGGKMYYEDGVLHAVVDEFPESDQATLQSAEDDEQHSAELAQCVPEGWQCKPFKKEGFSSIHGHIEPGGNGEPSEVYYVNDITHEVFDITPWWEEIVGLPNLEAVLEYLSLHSIAPYGTEYRP